MPCPFFQPERKVAQPKHPDARLPLLFEFEGICHAGETAIDAAHRFHYCNRGYAKGHCASFPESGAPSALRFNVAARTASTLTVMVMEERNYWPGACSQLEFLIEEGRLTPDIGDLCRRSQVFQFCRSYLERFQ